MAGKGWQPGLTSYKFTWDFEEDGGAVGTIALGNLPDDFIVHRVVAHCETAPVGGGSLVLGEDGAGDADGYFTDMDAFAAGSVLNGTGALVSDGTDNYPLAHIVDPDEDGVLLTIATTPYTAGKIHFHFVGVQGD